MKTRNPHHFWSCNVTTSTREPRTRAWISANIWRQDGAICSKNRKIVPYHGSASIPRLTVSVPDYGSWYNVRDKPDVIERYDTRKGDIRKIRHSGLDVSQSRLVFTICCISLSWIMESRAWGPLLQQSATNSSQHLLLVFLKSSNLKCVQQRSVGSLISYPEKLRVIPFLESVEAFCYQWHYRNFKSGGNKLSQAICVIYTGIKFF